MDESYRERMVILMEECAEVIQVASKILRHGSDSYNPFDTSRTLNRELLEREIGDLKYIIFLMSERGDIDPESVNNFAVKKREKISPYLHHNTVE